MMAAERIERFTMAHQYPIPVLGQRIPTASPDLTTDWVKRGSSTASAAVTFTGMKEGQVWEFQVFDKTTPATATPVNVYYRPITAAAVAATSVDAIHRSTSKLQRRILTDQTGYSFTPISGDITISAVRLV